MFIIKFKLLLKGCVCHVVVVTNLGWHRDLSYHLRLVGQMVIKLNQMVMLVNNCKCERRREWAMAVDEREHLRVWQSRNYDSLSTEGITGLNKWSNKVSVTYNPAIGKIHWRVSICYNVIGYWWIKWPTENRSCGSQVDWYLGNP